MSNTLIVGFGSPFGDDRFGWLVIEQLQEALIRQKGIKAVCCDHSGIDWLHQYQPADSLIFIDAVKSKSASGTLHHLILTPSDFNNLPTSYSSHGVGLREGLAIAAEVIALPPEIELYGVELGQCDAISTVSSTITEQSEWLSERLLERFSISEFSKITF